MQQYLQRVGLAPADLHQLNAIHVSGTKGKVGRAGIIRSRITPRRACAQRAIGSYSSTYSICTHICTYVVQAHGLYRMFCSVQSVWLPPLSAGLCVCHD